MLHAYLPRQLAQPGKLRIAHQRRLLHPMPRLTTRQILMQVIARVNHVFKDKPSGLIVDYLGLAHELRAALATYTQSGGTGQMAIDQEQAVAVTVEKYEICCGIFHGFDWSPWKTGRAQHQVSLLASAQEHVVAQAQDKVRLDRAVSDLSKALAWRRRTKQHWRSGTMWACSRR